MMWNWQKEDWANFQWDASRMQPLEQEFLYKAGIFNGMIACFNKEDNIIFQIDYLTDESLKTSEIEGEYLRRESVQSSLQRHFGIKPDTLRATPAEEGIAQMMTHLYQHTHYPLSHDVLFRWHGFLMQGRQDVYDIGNYRTDPEPMQVVSGADYKRKVHFEAPPFGDVPYHMEQFIKWFRETAETLPPLTRAGLAHLYFVSIHPFEDGNGRIARAISQKALAQAFDKPSLIALSSEICKKRNDYYQALERNNRDLEVTSWLIYFGETILKAQAQAQEKLEFILAKTKLYDALRGKLNERQDKVLNRLFKEGITGFKGGLSTDNYLTITGTSRATATRDLQDLIQMGALYKTGSLKSTRYFLNLSVF